MDVQKDIPHGLIGATGSGKSTLLQHLNGLYRPQSGTIRVGPFDLNAASLDVKALRRYAGMVFQNPESFFFEQYVGDEIAFGPKQIFGPQNLRENVMQAMELVGLDFFTYKDRVVSTLSGGEKRKTALAATLAMNPSMLILDEPTAGLDPLSRKNLLSTLHRLQMQGVQIVISSHNMEDISEIAQNVTVLAKGTSLTTLPVDQLFADQSFSKETGMEPPAAWLLAHSLRKKGWPISFQANTIQSIINETSAAINRGTMNQFDFLQKATIGQYIPADSLLHRIDPRAKIIGFGLLILAVTFSSSGIGVLIGLLAAWIGLLTARIPIQFALKGLIPPLPFLVLIALIQIFLLPKEGEQILFVVGPISIFAANVLNSLLMMLRFCVLILLLSLMTFCISSSELIHGLQQILRPLHRLGIPTMDLVIVIQITLRFLPFLAQSAEKIAKAQASRGAEWGTKNAGFTTVFGRSFP